MHRLSEHAGTTSVDDTDLRQMREIGVVEVLLQLRDRLCGSLADEIDLRRDAHRFLHADVAGMRLLSLLRRLETRAGYLSGIHELDIAHRYLGADDAGGDIELTVAIRQRRDRGVQVHGSHMDGVTDAEALRRYRLGRSLYLLCGREARLGLPQLLIQRGAGLVGLEDRRTVLLLLPELLHDGVRCFLGIRQDLCGFLTGLLENLVTALLDAAGVLPRTALILLDLRLIARDLLTLTLDGHAALLEACDDILELDILVLEAALRILDDVGWQAQLL